MSGLRPACGGRAVTSAAELPWVLSLLLAALAGLWAAVAAGASPLGAAIGSAAYAVMVTAWAWLQLADPGALPRHVLSLTDSGDTLSTVLAALPRGLRQRLWSAPALRLGGGATFCVTCLAWRPPGAQHCRVCRRCVAGWDHHCGVAGRCVGARNTGGFLLFLWAAAATAVVLVAVSAATAAGAILSSGEADQPGGEWTDRPAGQVPLWAAGAALAALGLVALCCAGRYCCSPTAGAVVGLPAAAAGAALLLAAYARAGASHGAAVPALLLAALTAAVVLPACAAACGNSVAVARRGAGQPCVTPRGWRHVLSTVCSRPPPTRVDWRGDARPLLALLADAVAAVDAGGTGSGESCGGDGGNSRTVEVGGGGTSLRAALYALCLPPQAPHSVEISSPRQESDGAATAAAPEVHVQVPAALEPDPALRASVERTLAIVAELERRVAEGKVAVPRGLLVGNTLQ